jgi:uncharacterized membrane protein
MSSDMEHDDKMLFFTLADRASADAAFQDVKELPSVNRAALLVRDADGKVTVPQDYDPGTGGAMVGFGTVGTILGLFIGPLATAIGIALGAGLGALADGEEATNETEALVGLSAWVDPGSCLLVAEMVESDPRAVDSIAERHGAALQRVPAAEAAEWLDQVRAKAEAEDSSDKGDIAL